MALKKKTPGLAATSAEGILLHFKPEQYKSLSKRHQRLLRALIACPKGLSREAADRAAPTSNSPEYIRQLRSRLGLELPCEMVPFVTVDGEASYRGVYHLTRADRVRLLDAIRGAA